MASDGKQLEALVEFVEKTLLPDGFTVSKNERIFNDDGVQIAEFDLEIRGKVGSTDIVWLIECRDRPTSGPAPGAWIEQLVGRRSRFGFNKITAVSTTGFAAGAIEFALTSGIEVREVKSLEPDEFSDWLYIRHVGQVTRLTNLKHAKVLIDESEGENKRHALEEFMREVDGGVAFLKSSSSGELVTPAIAFSSAASGTKGIFDELVENGPEIDIKIHATYTDEDHFVIDTAEGSVKVRTIIFVGGIRLTKELIPLFSTSEYRQVDTGEVISQVASFAPQSIHGMKFSTEIHKMGDSGETHIIMRRLKDDA